MSVRRPSALLLAAMLLAAPLLAAAPLAHASVAVEALLEQADAKRSTDPEAFRELLARLDARRGEATPAQVLRLRYLEAYRLGYEGKFDQAIRAATALFRDAPDPAVRYRAGLLATNSHAATRDFVAGLHQLEDTLALNDRIGSAELRHQGLNVAGILYNQLGQHTRARQAADQVLADAPDPRNRCVAGGVRIEALAELGEAPGDDRAFDQVIAQCSAIGVLEVHLPEVRATAYPRIISEIESLLAELHLAAGDAARAQAYAQSAVEHSAATRSALPVVVAHRILYQVALDRGDTALALEHYRKYAEADKAYLDDAKARELAYQTVRQQTREKTQTIELLNRQFKVAKLQEEVARKEAGNNLLLAALLAGLLASIAYWAYKVKRVQLSFRTLAETDALTGISNRHHFTKLVEAALAHCARSDAELGFVMFDLDNFKAINDRYGHAAGDGVLRTLADTGRALCRKDDHLSRIGGEEFAILLLDCELDAAQKMARACCERIASIDTAPSGHVFTISASFGVTSAGLAGNDFSRLLAQADQAMYRAKNEGRNRVVVHTLAPRVPGEATLR